VDKDRHDEANSWLSQFVNTPKNESSKCFGMIVAKQQKYIDEETIGCILELINHSDRKVLFILGA
jgi:hypothetical protein